MRDLSSNVMRELLLVEDDLLLANLLSKSLQVHGFQITHCSGFKAAVLTLKEVDFDLVLSDIDMGPGPSGIDLALKLAQTHSYLPVILISNYEVIPTADVRSLKNVAFFRKREIIDPDFLIRAIETVLNDSKLTLPHSLIREDSPLSQLTNSQAHVLKMIAEGFSNQEISEKRGTTLRATELIVSRIFSALNIESESHSNSRVLATRIYVSSLGFNR